LFLDLAQLKKRFTKHLVATVEQLPRRVDGLKIWVDVMITIFCDFPPFSAKKIGVFLKYQCYDQLFSKFSFVLRQKRQFFLKNFRRKYLKNHNIGPYSP
jgi:hypothetical protein